MLTRQKQTVLIICAILRAQTAARDTSTHGLVDGIYRFLRVGVASPQPSLLPFLAPGVFWS